MRVVIASPAQREFLQAIDFYEELAPGLGRDLIDEFDEAVGQIAGLPSSGSPFLHGTRRLVLQRFPYSLVYRLRSEYVEVLAFAHHARRPGYWSEGL